MDREDGAAVAGSALSARTRVLVVIAATVVIVIAVVAAIALVRRSTPIPVPAPSTGTPTPAPTPTGPPPPAAAVASDVFDGWSVSEGGGSTRFLQTDDHHGGAAALLIVRPAGDVATGVPSISQTVAVTQRSRILVSVWASTTGATAAGAIRIDVGGAAPATLQLPAGPFAWTRFTVAWTVPPGVTSAPISIDAVGETTGTRIDDVAVQGQGSRGVVVADPGFESSSAAVSITDTSLVLQRTGALHLASRLEPRGSFRWSAQEYTGGPAVHGRGRFAEGAASIPLSGFATGYYRLTLQVPTATRTTTRSTDLVVTAGVPAAATTPLLGVGVHLGATDGQLAQKLGDLAALGVRSARTDADWAAIEPRRDQYDFSSLDPVVAAMRSSGIRPLLIPDYRNPLYDGGRTPSSPAGIAAYARFAAALAAHYPDSDIDVYNEFDWRFNDGACGPTPQCYLDLLRATSAAVRATGTSATVAGPDISGTGVQQDWLSGFIGGGGLGMVGALDLHPYVQPARPDVLEEQLDALRTSMAGAGGGDEPIWFTEFGDATMPGWVSERQQAEDLARAFGVAAAHGVTRVYWYDAIDDGPDRADQEDNFGLFRTATSLAPAAFVPKPAAAVLATAARVAAGASPIASTAGSTAIRTVTLTAGDARVLLRWSPDGSAQHVRTAGSSTSMTGRPLGRARTVPIGSGPVWTRVDP